MVATSSSHPPTPSSSIKTGLMWMLRNCRCLEPLSPTLQTYIFVQVQVFSDLGDLLGTGLHTFAEEALQRSLHIGLDAGPAFSLPGLGQHLLCIAHLEVRETTHLVTGPGNVPPASGHTHTAGCRGLGGMAGFVPMTVCQHRLFLINSAERCSKSSDHC